MIDSLLGSILRNAWPKPSVDRLLRAALLEDLSTAALAWRDFETSADFDHLTAGEMRLIGLVSARLETLAPDSPMRARIEGIGRANWSRSQLAIGEAGSGLRAIEAECVNMLVIKGAGRIAAGGASVRGLVVNKVDIVVRPDDMDKAFELLTGDGWQPAGSGTVIYHRTRLSDAVGINLTRGQFGNLGLHRTAFYPPHVSTGDDASIWQRSASGKIAQATVRVPCATDALAIALAHGVPIAHKSGDWLADITAGIDSGVDWELFKFITERRRLHAPGAVALRYVRERLERPVPDSVLRRLENGAIRHPLALLAALVGKQAKARAIGLFRFVRAAARQCRFPGSRRRTVFPSLLRRGTRIESGPKTLEQTLALTGREPGTAWTGTIDLTLSVELPPASRRLDFEVNSDDKHHVRLSALVRDMGKRERLLRFRFPVALSADDSALVLTAAPSRSLGTDAPRHLTDRYGPTPFQLVYLRTDSSLPG